MFIFIHVRQYNLKDCDTQFFSRLEGMQGGNGLFFAQPATMSVLPQPYSYISSASIMANTIFEIPDRVH